MDSGERSEPKVVLLVRLLNAIDEGRHSFEDLKVRIADEKPPSTRTLRRYLSILADAGFPWYFDRRLGTYRFSEGYSLKRLNLSSRELFGLVTLKRLGASLGGTLASAIDDAASKLVQIADARGAVQLEGGSSLSLRIDEVVLEPEAERVFEVLREAEVQRRRVAFKYVDKNGAHSERSVDPYGFIVSAGRVYLVGYDHTRSDMRVFAVDNATAPKILPSRFERPADFDLNAFGAYSLSGVRHGEPIEVTIRFSPIVAKAARRVRIAPQRRSEEREDGSLDIVYAVADALEIVRWSLGWGGEAEVVAPPEVRSVARELVDRIAGRYVR